MKFDPYEGRGPADSGGGFGRPPDFAHKKNRQEKAVGEFKKS